RRKERKVQLAADRHEDAVRLDGAVRVPRALPLRDIVAAGLADAGGGAVLTEAVEIHPGDGTGRRRRLRTQRVEARRDRGRLRRVVLAQRVLDGRLRVAEEVVNGLDSRRPVLPIREVLLLNCRTRWNEPPGGGRLRSDARV